MAHRTSDQRLTAAGESLMIAAEPSPAHDPRKRSLDDPSPGQGTKARREELVPIDLFAFGHQQSSCGNGERFDDLDLPPQDHLGPGSEGTAVVAISPDQLEPGKRLLQWL